MVNILEKNLIISIIIDISLVFGPTIGYYAQLLKILKLKNSKGVSKLIPFLMVTANILRIYFWIGKRFQIVFLLQSIVSTMMQLVLFMVCFIYDIESKKESNLFDLRTFWNWPYLEDYLFVYTVFTVLLTIISTYLEFSLLYCEVLGILSVIVETSVSVPQIVENFKVKSDNNFSSFLIFSWISGDVLKVVLNILKEAPLQLIACGFFQFCCDGFIVGQLCYYRPRKTIQNEVKA